MTRHTKRLMQGLLLLVMVGPSPVLADGLSSTQPTMKVGISPVSNGQCIDWKEASVHIRVEYFDVLLQPERLYLTAQTPPDPIVSVRVRRGAETIDSYDVPPNGLAFRSGDGEPPLEPVTVRRGAYTKDEQASGEDTSALPDGDIYVFDPANKYTWLTANKDAYPRGEMAIDADVCFSRDGLKRSTMTLATWTFLPSGEPPAAAVSGRIEGAFQLAQLSYAWPNNNGKAEVLTLSGIQLTIPSNASLPESGKYYVYGESKMAIEDWDFDKNEPVK